MFNDIIASGEVKNVKLNYNEKSEMYYLSFNYVYEDESGIYSIEIPRVNLFTKKSHLVLEQRKYSWYDDVKVSLGFLEGLNVNKSKLKDISEEVYYAVRTLKEKRHEMTLDEIEKKLGYKITIVNK